MRKSGKSISDNTKLPKRTTDLERFKLQSEKLRRKANFNRDVKVT